METLTSESVQNSTNSSANVVEQNHDNVASDISDHGGKLLMEMLTTQNSTNSSTNVIDQNHDNVASDISDHGSMESKNEISEEEVRGILEVIAATGNFWHDWEKLKSMLSFYLKQVLSEYPEAKMTIEQQSSSLGETFAELVKRLDDALHSFLEGPPFTLQRLCEILLDARSIYPKLSKLALALEKILLVTSTLTICTDPNPPAVVPKSDEPERRTENSQLQPISIQNRVEPMVGDGDEMMVEVEEAEVIDDMTIDMETFEEIVISSEVNSTPTGDS